nr:polysaccharide deacetylase family protein [Candidatus Contubernalis alkalaceticus]
MIKKYMVPIEFFVVVAGQKNVLLNEVFCDDGPTEKTCEILELLEGLEVKATFFVTGRELEQYKEEGKNIVSAGHELGNHSYSHKRMVLKTPSFIRKEIELTNQLIREAGYQGEIHFRPPNGKKLVILPYI